MGNCPQSLIPGYMCVHVGHGEFTLWPCPGDSRQGSPPSQGYVGALELKPTQDPSLLLQGPTIATWELIRPIFPKPGARRTLAYRFGELRLI